MPRPLTKNRVTNPPAPAWDLREPEGAAAHSESEASFRLLFENNPLPMWVFDLETMRFLQVNDAAVAHYGYTREEFLIMRIGDLCPSEDEAHDSCSQPNWSGIVQASVQNRHLLKDGTAIDVEILLHRLEFAGRPAALVIAQDVTERRSMERHLRQAQKFEAIGQLAGGIAHDFNNVIGAILGWVELGLDKTPTDSPLASNFRRIGEQAERAAALTRQLLAFARRQILEPRNVSLNHVVADVIGLLENVIRKDVEMKTRLEPELETALADPTQIEQVLVNLCLNARDAMPGGGRLLIETSNVKLGDEYHRSHSHVQPGRYVLLSVTDNGTGMDAATRERIFEPFFTTKPVGKGTGLGLATVFGIVKQHGGFVHVYSEPGRGSTFRIYLPVSVKMADSRDMQCAKPAGERVRGGNEVILVAEDHDGIREMGRVALEGLGYRVILAANGEEAVDLYRANQSTVSLVVLDVVMPKIGGREAYERIRSVRGDIPVLFTTGYSAEAAVFNSMLERGAALLQKPYTPGVLARKVREVLDAAGPGEAIRAPESSG